MTVKEFLKYNKSDIYTYYMDMPCSIAATITENVDGTYTLYLNSRLTYQRQQEGCVHEIIHLIENDLNSFDDIQTIESRTHYNSISLK